MKACWTNGSLARAVAPSDALWVGTVRQPKNFWPSSTTMFSKSVSQVRRSLGSRGRKTMRHAVIAQRRQLDLVLARHLLEKAVGHLHKDAGAVAGVGLAAAGAAVVEVDQDGQGRRG